MVSGHCVSYNAKIRTLRIKPPRQSPGELLSTNPQFGYYFVGGIWGEKSGMLPTNPYADKEYVPEHDFFYMPSRLQAGQNVLEGRDSPFGRISAPEGRPGTVIILGHTPDGMTAPSEYALVGFGEDTNSPMRYYDSQGRLVYFVLHN